MGDNMAKTRTSSAVKNRYNAKVYDRFNVTVPKGRKAVIQATAKSAGVSLNAYVCQAIDYFMSDDEYCKQLYENYLANTDPDKDETISIEDFAKELGVKL